MGKLVKKYKFRCAEASRNRAGEQINHINENWLSVETRSADRTVKASGVTSTGARNIPLKMNRAGTGTEVGCKGSGSR